MDSIDIVSSDMCVWRVDWQNNITLINQAWMDFAVANGAAELPLRVIDTNLMDHIEGDEVKELTGILLDRVRSTNTAAVLPFQCDSPGVRRFMEMVIIPIARDGLEFHGRIVRVENREPLTFARGREGNPGQVLLSCSWCNRVELNDQWLEIDDAIRDHNLFTREAVPPLTHGLCPDCRYGDFSRPLH